MKTTVEFFQLDFMASLFPLQTNQLMMRNAFPELQAYVARVLSSSPADKGHSFVPQARAHAAKPNHHLRRTIVLDPVATCFLYDIVYRNRTAFDSPRKPSRVAFGYRFVKGNPIAVHKAFQDYSQAIDDAKLEYAYSLSFDIASYFNLIYHHDLGHWFSNLKGVSPADATAFSEFTREINAGRSVDFLPHGIYPAKMIGSAFLRFVEQSGQIKCARTLRFMDDIHLFGNNKETLIEDFLVTQDLLGGVALNVNPGKTSFDGELRTVQESASAIRERLGDILDEKDQPRMYFGSGVDWSENDQDESDEEGNDLPAEKIQALEQLLIDPRADETDVELILGILQDHDAIPGSAIATLYARFPNIAKQLYKLIESLNDKEQVATDLAALVESGASLLEYQLFWLAAIAEDHLASTKGFSRVVMGIYERSDAYEIAMAKVLEIPNQTFGLKEVRAKILKGGSSGWKSWAAAMGTRTLARAERNYALKYFANGSNMNQLIASCVMKL